MARSTFQPRVQDVIPRPANSTAKCGPCSVLKRDTQSKWTVRVAFTWMRGEDELVECCDEHLKELRKEIRKPGLLPDHWLEPSIWKV